MKPEFLADNELHTQIQYRLIEQISESERRYRELVENLREIVFKCDRMGKITLLNKAWTLTLGYETSECLNHLMDDYLYAEDRELWLNFVTQMHEKLELVCWELRFHHKNAEIIWLELSARSENEGEISGSLTNITDRKQAQEALKDANQALETRIKQLRIENQERQQAEATLQATLKELQQTHSQLIHAEKMSSLGQLVAGIAHEINNPINFIYGNISYANDYIQDLLALVILYQKYYPIPVSEIQEKTKQIDLNFLLLDLPKLISSMHVGAKRICEIVLSLRNFSRLDEAEIKDVDIHEGINSTLMILQNRLKGINKQNPIQVIKQYGKLPQVECYASQINQVFMNLLSNAIDAVLSRCTSEAIYRAERNQLTKEENSLSFKPTISIHTEVESDRYIKIKIIDNGIGMTEATKKRIFDPFFTTKPVGQGTGLGLSISYQIIVEKHGGRLECLSELGQGTEFLIQLPISLSKLQELTILD
jgi:two-component system, NtrC family, sensor kinase